MGEESRGRWRRRWIAGTWRGVHAEPPTSINDVSDDALELILLRVGTPVSLILAAATCKPWRRVIAGDGFLRRFRGLNGTHILGRYYYYGDGIRPIFVSLAAPGGKPAIDGGRVSLDFLLHNYLRIPVFHDSRGGLLLLGIQLHSIVIICSPWTRQHREIYVPSPVFMQPGKRTERWLGLFLLDDEMGLDMSNFRVLLVILVRDRHDDSKTVQAYVFSATDKDIRWVPLSTRVIGDHIIPTRPDILRVPFVFLGRAGGSLCWSAQGGSNVLLHLKESTGEFSYFRLPGKAGLRSDRRHLRVIGTMHLVRIVGNDLELLRYAAHDGGACVVERRINLSHQMTRSIESRARQPQDRTWYFSERAIEAAAPGCVVLCDEQCGVEYIWTFSVGTQNMKQESVRELNRGIGRAFPYELPWPPTLSAGLCDDTTKEGANNSWYTAIYFALKSTLVKFIK